MACYGWYSFNDLLSLGHVSVRHTETQKTKDIQDHVRGGCEVNCAPVSRESNTDKSVKSLEARVCAEVL